MMPTRQSAIELLDIEIAIREAELLRLEGPKYDWYGPDCGCPTETRKPNGACREHPRARPTQRPPEGDWQIWYLECGRGFGKTLSGSQWVRWMVETGQAKNLALVGPTAADVRDTMVGLKNDAGIIRVSPRFVDVYEPEKGRKTRCSPRYRASTRALLWVENPDTKHERTVATATLYSAEEPDRLRGGNTEAAWCDEIATWKDSDVWTQLMLTLRKGANPRCVVTTTPKPYAWLRTIKRGIGTILVRGTTYENKDNLAPQFFSEIITRWEGTKEGRRELEAIDEDDAEGALWTSDILDACRMPIGDMPEMERVIISVDPSVADPTGKDDGEMAECGITVVGMAMQEHPVVGWCAYAYLIADLSLTLCHPSIWGRKIIEAYHSYRADIVVAEVNNGGAVIEALLRATDPDVNYQHVHASRGKRTRAEPVAALYQQGRVFHARGQDFGALESQMTTWVPGRKSPDRLDALVWGLTEAVLNGAPATFGPAPFANYRGMDA